MSDEREGGLRRILNFGHTIGHAIETATGFKPILHGEAVGLGMIAAIEIAEKTELLEPIVAIRMKKLIASCGALPKVNVSLQRIFSLLDKDKKTIGRVPHFVLPDRIGGCEIRDDVPIQIVKQAISHIAPRKAIGKY